MCVKILIGFFLLENVLSFTNILRFNNLKINKISTIGIKKNSIEMMNKFKNNKINIFENFDWKKNWYPIAFEKYTNKKELSKISLLNEELVIWWDKYNVKWNTIIDKCPHRLVPLSEGRINEKGDIECPYHGWSFDGKGICTDIPQHPNFKINNNHIKLLIMIPISPNLEIVYFISILFLSFFIKSFAIFKSKLFKP